jgi:hypothetical protein
MKDLMIKFYFSNKKILDMFAIPNIIDTFVKHCFLMIRIEDRKLKQLILTLFKKNGFNIIISFTIILIMFFYSSINDILFRSSINDILFRSIYIFIFLFKYLNCIYFKFSGF